MSLNATYSEELDEGMSVESALFYTSGAFVVLTVFLIIPHRFQILPYSCAVLVLSICLYAILTVAQPDLSPPHPRLSLSPDLIQCLFLSLHLFSVDDSLVARFCASG